MTVAPSRHRSQQPSLLDGGADLVDLSLSAARGAAALQRLAAGQPADDTDRGALQALRGLLSDAAAAVEYFGSGGKTGGPPPHAALAPRVDVAIDAVLDQESSDPQVLASRLRKLASSIDTLEGSADAGAAESLSEFFAHLASTVLRQTGHVGEVLLPQ